MISDRVLKNTLFLYGRQIFILFVSLYTLRAILNALGVQDYGVYSVVAGIVALCSFLPAAMASASQRYVAFALGEGNQEKLRRAISVNWVIYLIIAIVAMVLLESIGMWFVQGQLKLPSDRFASAYALYHLAILTFLVGILVAPLMSIMIAHEDMHIFAYLSIAEAVVRLGVVFMLELISADKLELLGWLQLGAAVMNAAAYLIISFRKYPECRLNFSDWDGALFREIVGFTGWTLFGQLTTVARNQAVTVLLNQMFNPGVVAARALAVSISSQVLMFSNNFNTGLYPPIIKAYASNALEEMYSLVYNGSKLTFFLMWVFTLPLIVEMDAVLHLWLKTPPEDAGLFTQLALVENLMMSLSYPVATAARAPGRMKLYELTLGSIQLMILGCSWVILVQGGAPASVFVVAIVANIAMFIIRLWIVKVLIGLSIRSYFRRVMVPVLKVVVLSSVCVTILKMTVPGESYGAAFRACLGFVMTLVCIYHAGLDGDIRSKLRSKVAERLGLAGRIR